MASNPAELHRLGKKHSEIVGVVETYRELRKDPLQARKRQGVSSHSGDPELSDLARDEMHELEPQLEELESRLRLLMLPRDPTTTRALSLRSGQGPEGMRRLSLRGTSSACTPSLLRTMAGKWRS